MRLKENKLSLWSYTPDAPTPGEKVPANTELNIIVGVSPPSKSNQIAITYCVNQGENQTIKGKWLRDSSDGKSQYFTGVLPKFNAGDHVEYFIELSCEDKVLSSEKNKSHFNVVEESEINQSIRIPKKYSFGIPILGGKEIDKLNKVGIFELKNILGYDTDKLSEQLDIDKTVIEKAKRVAEICVSEAFL